MSDLDLENAETRLTLEKTLQENQRLKDEAILLKEKLAVAEASAARLSESVAVANAEAEVFRRQAGDMKLRIEALGPAATGGRAELEERLLSAINNLRVAEEDRKKAGLALKGLTEAAGSFAKASDDPKSRVELEVQMRRATELLTGGSPAAAEVAGIPATLSDGMVISIKDELGLVVANIGLRQGVAVGMPFQVIRNERLIGTVRVVDARDRIAGAVIQDLSSEKDKIKVGDRLKVAALR